MRIALSIVIALFALFPLRASESSALIVHEWGTFTSMQNEWGQSLGGMNNEEERLPNFVHTVGFLIQQQGKNVFPNQYMYSKGLRMNRPDITMRLETPVVYFHLPPGVKDTQVDLNVKFNGGYLTQFFPIAKAEPSSYRDLQALLTDKSVGTLSWSGLHVGTDKTPPETESEIWNAPRNVAAANVLASPAEVKGSVFDPKQNKSVERQIPQADRYLFYRGVGHLDAPLMITRNENKLTVYPRNGLWTPTYKADQIAKTVWLVDIREDGSVAWRRQELSVPASKPEENAPMPRLAEFSATFEKSEYLSGEVAQFSKTGMSGLKMELLAGLMKDGMYEDEAQALLNTWDASYFKAPGLRVFFMVPQAWTDEVLPLEVKTDLPLGKIKRAMVGRIELITPEQRALAGKVLSSGMNFGYSETKEAKEGLENYQKLGRFRNVILLDMKNKLEQFLNQ